MSDEKPQSIEDLLLEASHGVDRFTAAKEMTEGLMLGYLSAAEAHMAEGNETVAQILAMAGNDFHVLYHVLADAIAEREEEEVASDHSHENH